MGKTMLKQLFAGQLGLTYTRTMHMSWACGRPLDLAYGWDAASRSGIAAVQRDLQAEGSYCAVLTHPCGPWSKWSQFNIAKGGAAAETVLRAMRWPGRSCARSTALRAEGSMPAATRC